MKARKSSLINFSPLKIHTSNLFWQFSTRDLLRRSQSAACGSLPGENEENEWTNPFWRQRLDVFLLLNDDWWLPSGITRAVISPSLDGKQRDAISTMTRALRAVWQPVLVPGASAPELTHEHRYTYTHRAASSASHLYVLYVCVLWPTFPQPVVNTKSWRVKSKAISLLEDLMTQLYSSAQFFKSQAAKRLAGCKE